MASTNYNQSSKTRQPGCPLGTVTMRAAARWLGITKPALRSIVRAYCVPQVGGCISRAHVLAWNHLFGRRSVPVGFEVVRHGETGRPVLVLGNQRQWRLAQARRRAAGLVSGAVACRYLAAAGKTITPRQLGKIMSSVHRKGRQSGQSKTTYYPRDAVKDLAHGRESPHFRQPEPEKPRSTPTSKQRKDELAKVFTRGVREDIAADREPNINRRMEQMMGDVEAFAARPDIVIDDFKRVRSIAAPFARAWFNERLADHDKIGEGRWVQNEIRYLAGMAYAMDWRLVYQPTTTLPQYRERALSGGKIDHDAIEIAKAQARENMGQIDKQHAAIIRDAVVYDTILSHQRADLLLALDRAAKVYRVRIKTKPGEN